jgi:hypothetical protein
MKKRRIKEVRAIPPYTHPGFFNFKMAAFEAWRKLGGLTGGTCYPARMFHWLAFRYDILPTVWKSWSEVRLRFVEPISVTFDTYPDYAFYEVIPFVWDCWPCYFEKMCAWMKKHKVRTAIFTSSIVADRMRERFPSMHVMYCPEAVKTSTYQEGKPLAEREIDVLEFGRKSNINLTVDEKWNYVCTNVNGKLVYENWQLYQAMGNAKLTIALPRSITQPEVAGDVETLTQRYWENMLSRMVMVGHAPKELIDLVGYNPVVELDWDHPNEQIQDILMHIADFQELVDRNRETALQMGDWSLRMGAITRFLRDSRYEV